jgi:anthranilate phosphoribosyltransferase
LNGKTDGDLAVIRDLAIINAAAALYLSEMADNLQNAAAIARESIDSGRAACKLEALIRETNRSR